jgi:hypothetical protein
MVGHRMNIDGPWFLIFGTTLYVLEHHQYATKLMGVIMSGITVVEYILNSLMNVMVESILVDIFYQHD